jgi:tetratricopeptide (TPR) repeat protein
MKHVLARCMIGLLVATLAVPAFAQPEKEAFVPKSQGSRDLPQTKREADKKGPSLGGETFVRPRGKATVDTKWKEAFDLLKKLIESTPDENPEKPELYYRLSEMFWERASSTEIRGFDEEEACLKAKGSSEAAQGQCRGIRDAKVSEAQGYRDQAIKVYKHIVQKFPSYPRLDEVLFALAFNFLRKGDIEGAKKIFVELIRRYPDSGRMPDTLLNLGEIYFEEGQVEQASKFYGKVAENYRDAPVYGYALYKLGWCFFNLQKYTEAMRQFLAVIEHTNKQTTGTNRLSLKREAQKDLVRTYVNIEGANPTKAIAFFRKVAPDDYLELAERLADLYSVTGQFQKSNELFRELIRLRPKEYIVLSYQIRIAENTRNLGQDPVEGVRELKRLVSLWQTVKDAKDAKPEQVQRDKELIEEQLRQVTVNYHQQYAKTKAEKDAAITLELYSDYVKVFPDGPNAYDMTFYYAEFLYQQKKWKEAANAYERALEIKPEGEHTKDAAQGTVLAYKKLLQPKQDNGDAKSDKAAGEAEVPKAEEIPEDYQRFLKAQALYIKYVKESEYLVDIKYDEARIYYEFNHFDQAAPRFQDICHKHADHRLAVFACNLLLDIQNLQKDYEAMHVEAKRCVGSSTAQRDPELMKLCGDIIKTYDFKKCQGQETEKKWVPAARCYYGFAQKFPTSEIVDKAYFNAALNFERAKRIEDAIQMRLLLVNNVSGSELVPKSLYDIGLNLQALAIYSKAAEALEFYAAKFPGNDEAKEALRRATLFREGLGQLAEAEKNARAYLKLIDKSDKAKAAEIFFTLGKIYEKQEDWDRVVRHYQEFLRDYKDSGSIDLLLESYTRIGNAYMAMKKPDEKKAQGAYKAAYDSFKGLSPGQMEGLTTGLAAVAEARFKMGEAIFTQLKSSPLKVKSLSNLKKYVEEMTNAIRVKSEVATQARAVYIEVIEFKSPNWAIAALARIGEIFENLSDEIYNLPPPKNFDEEQVEAFKTAMAERAEVPRSKAKEAFELCLAKARELRWFNQWSDVAERRLADLMPEKYRYNAEVRAKPDHFGPDIVGQRFIGKLEEPEEEQAAPPGDADKAEGGELEEGAQ